MAKKEKITKEQVLEADKRIHAILEELDKMGKAADLLNKANKNSSGVISTSSELLKKVDSFVKDSKKEIKDLRIELDKHVKLLVENTDTSIKTLLKQHGAIEKSITNLYTKEDNTKNKTANTKNFKKIESKIDSSNEKSIKTTISILEKIILSNESKFGKLDKSIQTNQLLTIIILSAVVFIAYLLITI